MNNKNRLVEYFKSTLSSEVTKGKIGMEVETCFVDKSGNPISTEVSQKIFRNTGWEIKSYKNGFITELQAPDGSSLKYELGRQNLELSLAPYTAQTVIQQGRKYLDELYAAAERAQAFPYFDPILETKEDLLMIPDERDATWLKLDGRPALNILTACSSVQFTIESSYKLAPVYLERLLGNLNKFLDNYPQEKLWRQYIAESKACYRTDRYGGPVIFESIEDYCEQLIKNDVVSNGALVTQAEINDYDLNLFLKSVWWYFRLRRYGNTLCIEVRPQPRLKDSEFKNQLQFVMDCVS